MESILYYSNLCPNCKKALAIIARSDLRDKMHFINIDNRKIVDGQQVVVFENGSNVKLPPSLSSVPSILLLNRGYRLIVGNELAEYIQPRVANTAESLQTQSEPESFSFGGGGHIASDQYSFLDQTVEELEAKGNGGSKQLHHYASPSGTDSISTPPDMEADSKRTSSDSSIQYSAEV